MDPINNEISTPTVINNVVEDVSSLLLVVNEVAFGVLIKEPFEVDCVASNIESSATVSVDEPFKVDCVTVSVIGLSVMAVVIVGDEVIAGTIVMELFEVDCIVSVIGLSVIADEPLNIDCVVKVIRLLVTETLFGSIAANIKEPIAVLLISSDFTATVVVEGEIIIVGDTTIYVIFNCFISTISICMHT